MKTLIFFIVCFQIEAVAQDLSVVFTAGYQESQHNWIASHLLSQRKSVTCEGETIFFTGGINHSSVRKLFRLVDMKYPVEQSEIADMLYEIGVDISVIPRCYSRNNYIIKEYLTNHLEIFKTREQDPVRCQPKKMVISSQGGTAHAALRLYYFIRKNSLSVEIPNGGICMSACTHIRNFSESFSAGPDSLFMFHGIHLMGRTLKRELITVCSNSEEDLIKNQIKEAFWQMDTFFSEQVREGVNQFGNFFVRYDMLETWGY